MGIVVTGASGQLGRRVTDLLLRALPPSELILVSRNTKALSDLEKRGCDVRFGDFDKPQSLTNAFQGGERMLLISTLSVGRRAAQHSNAINAARAAGVRHIVYTSSGGARPDNPAIVIADHLGTESALKTSGVAYTILRDSLYAEAPVLEIAPRAIASGKWITAAGDGKSAFVAKADCVACAAQVLLGSGHEQAIYEITGPELLSFRDAASLAAEISGRPIDFVVVSDTQMDEMLASVGVPKTYAEGMVTAGVGTSSREDIVSYEQGLRGGYFAVLSNDVAKLLGRPPQSLREVFMENKERLRAS